MACGITVGTPVRIRGVPVGSVLSVQPSLEKVGGRVGGWVGGEGHGSSSACASQSQCCLLHSLLKNLRRARLPALARWMLWLRCGRQQPPEIPALMAPLPCPMFCPALHRWMCWLRCGRRLPSSPATR